MLQILRNTRYFLPSIYSAGVRYSIIPVVFDNPFTGCSGIPRIFGSQYPRCSGVPSIVGSRYSTYCGRLSIVSSRHPEHSWMLCGFGNRYYSYPNILAFGSGSPRYSGSTELCKDSEESDCLEYRTSCWEYFKPSTGLLPCDILCTGRLLLWSARFCV